jgi:thiol-disulfide isomerase/thioredoxin
MLVRLFLVLFAFSVHFNVVGQYLKEKGGEWFINYKKKSKYPQGPELGTTMPEIGDLVDIEGDTISFDELNEGITVLNFWFVGCKGCKMEEPNLKALSSHFEDQPDIKFISFYRSSPELIDSYFAKNEKFGYKVISVQRPFFLEKFNTVGAPSQFYYLNGRLIDRTSGAMESPEKLEWMINYLNGLSRQL